MPKVAAIQMCSSHIVNENLIQAKALIKEAAENGAKLIVLPEMFAIMGINAKDKVVVKEKFNSGIIQDFLSEQARTHNIWIVGGTIPIACEIENKIRAASILFNDQGEITARYDKIHLFDVEVSKEEIYKESDSTQPGEDLVVVETPVGKIGMSVCYDIRFPELYRCLFNKGAEIFVIPSAFTVKTGEAHWELFSRSRAVENFAYVIGAAQGGTHSSGRKTFGNSLIIEPWGNITAKNEGINPGVIYTEIDLSKLYETRKAIPVDRHQKIFFDTPRLITNDNCSNKIHNFYK